jgi:hypothetical protein
VDSPEASDLNAGDVFFGFTGGTPGEQLLVRWNVSYVNFFEGKAVAENKIVAVFGRPPRG